MRYLFKRLDQQTTTTAHPQWAMGTHRSAPCLHLDGLVTHLDTLIFFEFPLAERGPLEYKENFVCLVDLVGVDLKHNRPGILL